MMDVGEQSRIVKNRLKFKLFEISHIQHLKKKRVTEIKNSGSNCKNYR